jgi:hypothetical protein
MFDQNRKTFLVSRADDKIFYELDLQMTPYSMQTALFIFALISNLQLYLLLSDYIPLGPMPLYQLKLSFETENNTRMVACL